MNTAPKEQTYGSQKPTRVEDLVDLTHDQPLGRKETPAMQPKSPLRADSVPMSRALLTSETKKKWDKVDISPASGRPNTDKKPAPVAMQS